MEDPPALQPMLDALQAALIPPTRSAAQLPSSSDLSFERTLSRSLARNLDAQSAKVLQLAQSLLDWTAGTTTGSGGRVELDSDLIKDGEYSALTLAVEQLLEHADEQIEKHLGTGKHKKATTGAAGAKSFEEMEEREKLKQKVERLPARLLHDSTLPKPQLRFTTRTKVEPPTTQEEDEEEEGAIPLWKPILRNKVNGRDGEGEGWLQTEVHEPTSRFTSITDTTPPRYSRYVHPYKLELSHLEPPSSLFEVPDDAPGAIPKDSFDKTPFEWIGTREALDKMVEEIRQVGEAGQKELAIDLEHHDFRSWSGFTCLIQLSTRKKDYVIDAIDPQVRDSLETLNEFFTDPSWVKVLHGASSDVVWLQRDFGLYIVGLFDTYHATHVLGYSQHSLASLLDMYTDFHADKRYQLADWRIRPLPKEMLHYARSDTHYLLAIYDHLRIALSNKALSSSSEGVPPLAEVFHRSTLVSSTVFSLPPYDHATGHFDSGFLIPLSKSGQIKSYATALAVPTLPIKTGWGPGEVRLEVLRDLMRWRERVAREEDESPRYVMGIQGVLQTVEQYKRIMSGGSAELVRCLGGTRGGVSEVVRRRKEELIEVIQRTAEKVEGNREAGQHQEMALDTNLGVSLANLHGTPSFEPAVKPIEGLWDSATPTPIASTSTSSFFGNNPHKMTPTASTSTASSSSFFGSASSTKATTTMKGSRGSKGKQPARRSENERKAAVSRIHDALTLGGGLAKSIEAHSLPVAPGAAATPASVASSAPVDPSLLPVPLPVPDASFVPFDSTVPSSSSKAIGSTTHAQSGDAASKPKDSDVIVVSSLKDKPSRSSQAQAKKRRRAGTEAEVTSEHATTAAASTVGAVSPPPQYPQAKKQKKKKATLASSSSDQPPQSIVPHDYSGSTSILDAGPAVLSGMERRDAEKKQKKKDKAAAGASGGKRLKVDTSDFKRPMRVDNAPKKAQKSQTFQN